MTPPAPAGSDRLTVNAKVVAPLSVSFWLTSLIDSVWLAAEAVTLILSIAMPELLPDFALLWAECKSSTIGLERSLLNY